jgi:hypothetical protein
MACMTCDHTMHRLSSGDCWCPRCGTLISGSGDRVEIETPMLVDRCRKFSETLGPSWSALWHQLGIEESIRVPHRRAI